MKKVISIVGLLSIILIFLAGCGPSAVVVRNHPEAPYYAHPSAPGPNYIWVDGEWIRRGHNYSYRQGFWAPPRQKYHQYQSGHWQQTRKGWYWVPGRWN